MTMTLLLSSLFGISHRLRMIAGCFSRIYTFFPVRFSNTVLIIVHKTLIFGKFEGCRFVELTQGRIRRGNQDELSEESKNELSRELEERLPQWIPYQIKPPMGSSIGVSDKNWSTGTFGGYVELENGVKEKKMCGITCHHVLRPAVDKKPPPEDHFSKLYPPGHQQREGINRGQARSLPAKQGGQLFVIRA